jgi:hypothetical protein
MAIFDQINSNPGLKDPLKVVHFSPHHHTTPIHETLVKAKVSLLNVVKNFKFGAKITLTSISLSFITHLPSNKQTQVQVSYKVSSFTLPLHLG